MQKFALIFASIVSRPCLGTFAQFIISEGKGRIIMNTELYETKMAELEVKHTREQEALKKEFALSNNKVQIGSIVTDHLGRVLVERIRVLLRDPPECVYYGQEITKAGNPFKNGHKRNVYTSNLQKEGD